jgi:hypothetical protein
VVVRDSGTTGMSPGVALATFHTARHRFNAGEDKTLPNLSLAASLLAPLDTHFQLGPFRCGSREQNVGITYVGGCAM